jgi:hypothetical protein
MVNPDPTVALRRLQQTLGEAKSAVSKNQEWADRVRANWRDQTDIATEEEPNGSDRFVQS